MSQLGAGRTVLPSACNGFIDSPRLECLKPQAMDARDQACNPHQLANRHQRGRLAARAEPLDGFTFVGHLLRSTFFLARTRISSGVIFFIRYP